jgi:hypothetical protein
MTTYNTRTPYYKCYYHYSTHFSTRVQCTYCSTYIVMYCTRVLVLSYLLYFMFYSTWKIVFKHTVHDIRVLLFLFTAAAANREPSLYYCSY